MPKTEPPAAPLQKPVVETKTNDLVEQDTEDEPLLDAGDEESVSEEPPAAIPEVATAAKDSDIDVIWQKVLDNIDAPLASKLEQATIELRGDQLQVTLQSSQALFIDMIRKSVADIEKILSEHAGKKLIILLSAEARKKAVPKKDLKKKASDEPVVKEALELFDGRIIDVIPVESQTIKENGGVDV